VLLSSVLTILYPLSGGTAFHNLINPDWPISIISLSN